MFFSIFSVFLTVYGYLMNNFCPFLQRVAWTSWTQKAFDISSFLRYIIDHNFCFFNSAPYRVIKKSTPKIVFCTKNNADIFIFKENKELFFRRKLRHIAGRLRVFAWDHSAETRSVVGRQSWTKIDWTYSSLELSYL